MLHNKQTNKQTKLNDKQNDWLHVGKLLKTMTSNIRTQNFVPFLI